MRVEGGRVERERVERGRELDVYYLSSDKPYRKGW